MPDINLIKKYSTIHMIGIGGISMSGIAEILKNFGVTVTGSDISESEITQKLREHGITVVIGHDLASLSKADAVVYSAAVKSEDPEMVRAKELGIPTIERCDFLGMITKAYTDTIGISGTHGKTTTTSMVSLCFLEAGLDPSIQVGALLKQIDGNYKVGNSEHFIIEACEYVESFLKFYPKAEVILNIDNDHLDYFKTLENVKNAFKKYVHLIPEDGALVINGDDKNCLDLKNETKASVLTYGIENVDSDFTARNITFDDQGFPSFDVYHKEELFGHFTLAVPGAHNILNSLACIALCYHYQIKASIMITALADYTGAHRRFEFVGNIDTISIFDDYGHHPTEIKATSNALKQKKYHESWVVFQPHTYSRTKNLLDDFANSLVDFDHIILVDIYAAREQNTYGISSKDVVDKIKELGKEAIYLSSFEEVVIYLKQNIKPNDIILTQGAGTVTNIGPMMLD